MPHEDSLKMDIEFNKRVDNIIERHPGLYEVILSPGTIHVMKHILPSLPSGYIWLIDYGRRFTNLDWISENVPSIFGENSQDRVLEITSFNMDVTVKSELFLSSLDNENLYGTTIVYSSKPKPEGLDLENIHDKNKAKVFLQNHIEFFYHIPHPYEYALLLSPNIDLLNEFINANLHDNCSCPQDVPFPQNTDSNPQSNSAEHHGL